MAYIVADRVKETTTVTGTGPTTLAGAASGYRSFASQLSIGDTCAYVIVNSNWSEWETGIGTYSATNTLTRTTVQASTNANAAVVFSAGTKDVFMGPTADSLVDYNPVTGAISNATWNGSTISTSKGGTGLTTIGTANQLLSVNSTATGLEYKTFTSNPGTVTSVSGTGTVNGLTLTGTVTSSGNLTLGGTLSNVNLASQITGTLPVDNGGTGSTTASGARTNLGLVIGTDVLAPNGSAASLTNFPTLNQNTTGTAANVTGIVAVVNGGTGVTTSTGTGSVVLSNTPTLVTPQTNAINAVPVVSGAGNNLTFTAGSGVTSGAGGNIILQPGAQATSGGNGQIIINTSAGVNTGFNFTNTYATYPTLEQARLYIRSGSNNNVIEFRADLGSMSSGPANSQFLFGGNNTNYVGIRENGNAGTLGIICGSSSAGGSLNFISSTTAIAANTNDLALSASAFQRISCTTNPYNLTGIAPVTGTGSAHKDGRMIRIYNVGTPNLTLVHNSALSIAANRMFSSTGADIVLGTNDYAELIWDGTNNGSGGTGWRVS